MTQPWDPSMGGAPPWDPSMGGAPPTYHEAPPVSDGAGGAPADVGASGSPSAPAAPPPALPLEPDSAPLPNYLTRGFQDAAHNNQAPAQQRPRPIGGGMPRIEMQGVQMFDDQLVKLEGDFHARLQRVLEDPAMPQDIKAQTVAQMRSEYTANRAQVSAKRAAFMQTSEGMGERVAQLGMEGQRAQIETAGDIAKLEGEASGQRADMVGQQQDRREAQLRAEQQERAEIDKRVTATEDAYRAGLDEYRALASDEDAGKLSTGQSILGGLGVVLAGIATGMTGKQFGVNEVLERAIERKMREHQQNLQNKRAELGDKRDLIGIVRAQYADAEQGWQAARLALKEQAVAEIQQLSHTTQAKRAGMVFDANVEQLQRSVEQDRLMLRKTAVDRYNAERQAAAAAAAAAAAQRRRMAMVERYGQELSKEDEGRLIPGAGLLLRGGDIKQARDEYAEVTNQKQLFDRVQGVLGKAKGGQVLSPTDKETLNLFRSQLASKTMQELYGAGNEEQFAHAAAVAGVPVMDWTDRQWTDMSRLVGTGKSLADAKHQNWVDRNVDRGATMSYTDPETGRTVWHFNRGTQAAGGANIRPGVAR